MGICTEIQFGHVCPSGRGGEPANSCLWYLCAACRRGRGLNIWPHPLWFDWSNCWMWAGLNVDFIGLDLVVGGGWDPRVVYKCKSFLTIYLVSGDRRLLHQHLHHDLCWRKGLFFHLQFFVLCSAAGKLSEGSDHQGSLVITSSLTCSLCLLQKRMVAKIPAIVWQSTHAPSGELPEGMTKIRGYDFNQGADLQGVMKSSISTGFQASSVGQAIDTINLMVRGWEADLYK